MDDFEKLGRLVGASVEAAPGQGLPRTMAEAQTRGMKRYFTGKPCKHGHMAERYAYGGCVECARQRDASLVVKERKRAPEAMELNRLRVRKYSASPEAKERGRQYRATSEVKERKRRYEMAKTGDATLFAINQAEMYAVRARAYADIVPQCPDPQRSQLQALIDRIRADPSAGKAVIGLLRTMRELRKAELAQQRADTETTAAESNT